MRWNRSLQLSMMLLFQRLAREERDQLVLVQARQEARREGERVRSKLCCTYTLPVNDIWCRMPAEQERADFEAEILRKHSLALEQKEEMERLRAVSVMVSSVARL